MGVHLTNMTVLLESLGTRARVSLDLSIQPESPSTSLSALTCLASSALDQMTVVNGPCFMDLFLSF